ncbi:DUF427 domain-containing protein [Bacillus gobiensis]|uniref:DUF427 domain-containing protein n=1 Tax=Bacillus gobiensis TaxID=1441095 RepID=UPI003D255B43
MTKEYQTESCHAIKSKNNWRIKVEPTARRVSVVLNSVTIADSKKVKLVHETGHLPVYYFPKEDVRSDLFEKSNFRTTCSHKGEATHWHVKVGDQVAENAAWSYTSNEAESLDIKGYYSFYWEKVDHWYEESEEIFVHPRDPYKRVDAIKSSRHIQIVLNDITLADSNRPVIVFETGVPVRYYIPEEDVRTDVLKQTNLVTRCPYKGEASYWNAELNDKIYENIVWSYLDPIQEISKIKGLFSFYNEKVDVYIDGEKEEKPKWYLSALDFYNENEKSFSARD